MQLSDIQPIIDECVELEELNFFQTQLSEGSIDYLVKNITPKLSKLYLFTNLVQDKHIEVLVGRTEGTVMSEGTIFMHNR